MAADPKTTGAIGLSCPLPIAQYPHVLLAQVAVAI